MRLRKARKVVFRTLLTLILLLLTMAIVLSIPSVQTRLAAYATDRINADYHTDIKINSVALTLFGGVKFRDVMIRDHHRDTLIYAKRIQTDILSFRKLYNGDLMFGDVSIDGMVFNLRNYKGEADTNLDVFIARFETEPKKASTHKFLLEAKNAYFTNSRFMLFNDNRQSPKDVYFSDLSASLNNFRILGPDITAKINKLAFTDFRGVRVKNLSSRFTYTKKNILMEDLSVETRHSKIYGFVRMYYDRKDFMDFNNKVLFKVRLDSTQIGSNDVKCFYNEIATGHTFRVDSDVSGTLNNLFLRRATITEGTATQIRGDLHFRNLWGKEGMPFRMDAQLGQMSTNYGHLVSILPRVLGNSLPENLKTLGQANLKGSVEVTARTLKTDVFMTSAIGNVKTDFVMTNMANREKASYVGNVELENFNLGRFLSRKELGPVSLALEVNGSGFTQSSLRSSVKGSIDRFYYNRYNYSNIVVDGDLRSPMFKGKLVINDPNLFMDFDGLVDMSKKQNRYDLHANIDFANLNKLHFSSDPIAIFKGEIRADVVGSTIDNMRGTIGMTDTSYQNQKDTYLFEDLRLTSEFDPAGVRTLTIVSPDIIEGKVMGRFRFGELRKMLENSIGSLYTNYKPNKVSKGQFLRFDFSIYNKIVEVFLPGIEVSTNTFVKGNIDSDTNEFRLNFSSPEIKAYDNSFERISLTVDNKNPLFNAYIETDTIRTKYYKFSDFSAINVTKKDTMYVRSEFKGGPKATDAFTLNLYHTIDKNNNNVVGIQKSELRFGDFTWFLNELDGPNNRVIFDKKLQRFDFDNIAMSHEDQRVSLHGAMRDSTYKDLDLDFEKVDLARILPSIDSLRIAGRLDGDVRFKQEKAIYQPTSHLTVSGLAVNDIGLGNLDLSIEGDNSFKTFKVESSLENDNVKSFLVDGTFNVENRETTMDLHVNFDQFNIAAFSPLGKDILSNIRGYVSGTARVTGPFREPDIFGKLFLEEAGFRIPYLNTDYAIRNYSIVDIADSRFTFRNNTLTDTKYKTEGKLNGFIRHKNFSDWALDLNVTSDRFLALDTEDHDDAAYFGTAFIDGKASITGPTSSLFIEMAAKSAKGTHIGIPISNTENVGSRSFIHFLSPKEKYNLQNGLGTTRRYDGLELQFDLDITPDAEIEVILDRETGHGMRGRGNGTLLLEINTLGKFNMYGDYQVYEGEYNFKYKGLFDKRFTVKKYSSITWEGDPMRARLNLEATYKTSANPSILLENPSVNRKVDVLVGIIITGNLASPEPDFSINFPNMNSVLRSEIESKLSDKDIRQTQALTLLSTGGFMSSDGVNQSAIVNNVVETGTGLFGDIFQSKDDKFRVNPFLETAERTPGYESNGAVGFTVSSQINDRITVNGKVGVPVGGLNQSAVVGDVEVQYRVNEDGTMNLRFFNRENDINYLGEGIGYTQGVGVTYQVDFDTFQELVKRIFGTKTVEKAPAKKQEEEEEPKVPEGMHFNTPEESRKKKETKRN